MTIVIKSGDSSDTLTIDPVSKAARAERYASDGFAITAPLGVYLIGINFRYTSTATDDITFALANPSGSGRVVIIRRLFLQGCFDDTNQTPVTTAGFGFYVVRSSGTLSGGTTLTPGKFRTSFSSSVAVPRIKSSAISATSTETATQLLTSLYLQTRPATADTGSVASVQTRSIRHKNGLDSDIWSLQAGESLLIRTSATSTFPVGGGLYGMITWEER